MSIKQPLSKCYFVYLFDFDILYLNLKNINPSNIVSLNLINYFYNNKNDLMLSFYLNFFCLNYIKLSNLNFKNFFLFDIILMINFSTKILSHKNFFYLKENEVFFLLSENVFLNLNIFVFTNLKIIVINKRIA